MKEVSLKDRKSLDKKGPTKKEDLPKTFTFTAQTYIPDRALGESGYRLYDLLSETADLYNRIKRALFRDTLSSGKPPLSFKNAYLKRFNITARQFNAIRFDLGGNIESVKELRKLHIQEISERIASSKKWLKKMSSKIRKIRKDKGLSANEKNDRIHSLRFCIHNKKRKLHSLEEKLAALKKDQKDGKVKICFGTKAFFHKQFNLIKNGYVLHEEWVEDWKDARSSTFMMLGSKDETGGNQTCTLFKSTDLVGSFTVRARVPEKLMSKYGRHVSIGEIVYPYGLSEIENALAKSQAITHRFVRGERGWYLHSSVNRSQGVKRTSHSRDIGCIGVDVNEKEIAVAETDRFGNIL